MDTTALNSLKKLQKACEKRGTVLILSHVNPQPMSVMEKAGFVDKVGRENFCGCIDEALRRAETL